MRFEEREIKPYAEPVSSTQLQEGSIYYAVNYVPGDMTIPVMETLVFIGRNLDSEDAGRVYFQDVRSYRRGVRYDDANENSDETAVRGEVFAGPENQVNHIFEYEQALDSLIECWLRRNKVDTGTLMRFGGRELKPYAEPISATELQERQVYFALEYADDDLLIPVMDTHVFIGMNLETGEEGKIYFQDVDSYQDGVRYGAVSEDEQAEFYTASENQLNRIFDFERALDELMRCSLRRRNV